MTRQPQAGVTLIEVLVSLALFALIAGAGLSVLDQVLRAQSQTEARLERLALLQRMMHLVRRDLSEAAAGTVQGDDLAIMLDRSVETGSVTISYAADAGQLARAITQGDGTVSQQALLADVTDLRWQYLDDQGAWHDVWPLVNAASAPGLRAVAMTLALSPADQSLRRVVTVPQRAQP